MAKQARKVPYWRRLQSNGSTNEGTWTTGSGYVNQSSRFSFIAQLGYRLRHYASLMSVR